MFNRASQQARFFIAWKRHGKTYHSCGYVSREHAARDAALFRVIFQTETSVVES